MKSSKYYIFISDLLSKSTKFVLFYLVFSAPLPQVEHKKQYIGNDLVHFYNYKDDNGQRKTFEKKLFLDLSKKQVLNLIDTDTPISISIDTEGKIIGYRPFISKMPSYWNSEVTKKLLVKNNLFSLSYKKDQIISFQLSSL